ncbi:hypothetical protein HD806DRAFT_489278 [Xylariaceae sp. AK1471]|nr:hypothetical protein HD806DRAFT_489278 [Xylariaceae sp. AK1471]
MLINKSVRGPSVLGSSQREYTAEQEETHAIQACEYMYIAHSPPRWRVSGDLSHSVMLSITIYVYSRRLSTMHAPRWEKTLFLHTNLPGFCPAAPFRAVK